MSTCHEVLQEQIAAEHSKSQTIRIVRWIGHDAERLAALMDIFLGSDYRLTQRSAWVVRYVGEYSPALLGPWHERMIASMNRKPVHGAVKRNVLRMYECIEIPSRLYDALAEIGFSYLADAQEDVAVRCTAMTVLGKICQAVPDLKPELRLLVEEHYEHGSAAFKSRARKVLGRM